MKTTCFIPDLSLFLESAIQFLLIINQRVTKKIELNIASFLFLTQGLPFFTQDNTRKIEIEKLFYVQPNKVFKSKLSSSNACAF